MTKQQEVQVYLSKVKDATIDEIYQNVSFAYYCNENKHLGALLSRMVKTGKVERVKRGVFRNKINYKRMVDESENQKSLFT